MNLNEYQELALRTANSGEGYPPMQLGWALGLCGEAGEAAEIVKKHYYHRHPINWDQLEDELGDVLFYLAMFAHSFNLTLEQIALHNVRKLQERYPEGFNEERSINRDE